MRRFFASASSEFKKFFSWKTIAIFAILVIVLALISMPVFEKFHKLEFNENSYNFDKEELEQRYIWEKEAYEKNPLVASFYKIKYYEYLLEHEQIYDNVEDYYRSKGNYINYAGLFVYGLFALVIIFAGMIMSKEYSSKNILPLSCVPIKKRYILVSKFLVVSIFSLLMVFLFFTVVGLGSLKYGGTDKLLVMYGYLNSFTIQAVSYPQAIIASAILTWFACLTMGAFSMFISTVIKNIYFCIPGSILLAFIPIAIGSIQNDIKGVQSILPYYNVFYHNYTNSLKARSVINSVWVFILIHIVTSLLIVILCAVIFEKRQVKE